MILNSSQTIGYVYVITTKLYENEKIYKIGCTKNIKERLKLINSTRILSDYFFVIKFWNTYKYYETESGIHKKLAKYRLNNEFFQCDLNIIEEEMKKFCLSKNLFFIIPDSIYFFLLENNLYWDFSKNIFYNDKNYSEIDEEIFIKNFKIYLKKFDKNNLSRFFSNSVWNEILIISKNIKFKELPNIINNNDNLLIDNLSLFLDNLSI